VTRRPTVNILVDAVVQEWISQMLGPEAAQNGYGNAVASFLSLYYIDNAIIAEDRDPERLQRSAILLSILFDRVGLHTNTVKTKAMTCVPGKIRKQLLEVSYTNSRVGLHTVLDLQDYYVECDHCGDTLQASSLRSHLETQHDVFQLPAPSHR